ncbi:hypothetical protein [Niastella vici]|nr:hypothetical protein [Niastella vici]
MKKFEELYVDQITLLEKQGYNFSDQHSSLANTDFLGKLLYKFLKAYQKSNKLNQPNLFYISTTGLFKKIQDEIKIVFNYKYSLAEPALSIQSLYVTMKGIGKSIPLNSNAELPKADTILETMIKAYEAHPKKKYDDFLKALDTHKNLLIQKGFDEKGLDNQWIPIDKHMDRVMEGLKTGLLENIATPFLFIMFDVETKGYFNNKTDVVEFKFGYQYDPHTVSLGLKTLTAKMDDTKTYYLKTETDLPHSSTVHKHFSENQKLLREIIPALNNKYGHAKKVRPLK